MLSKRPLPAYLLFGGVEPEADTLVPGAVETLGGARLVVAVTPYVTETLKSYAHVLLPIGTFAETSGTFVNVEGRWQSFRGAASGRWARARPGWKVLRVLGNLLGVDGFDYDSSDQVREELVAAAGGNAPAPAPPRAVARRRGARLHRRAAVRVDAIVRRAPALQHTRDAGGAAAPEAGRAATWTTCGLWNGLTPDLQSVVITTAQIVAVMLSVVILRGLPDAGRAQGDRLHAAAARAEPHRHLRPAVPARRRAAVRRRHQAAAQGSAGSGERRPKLFLLAPLIVLVPALAAWAVIPFSPEFVLADIDAGLLYVLALTSLGVYGVILAGWAANSKYAFLGAMRSAAQMVAYEIAMGFALVGVLMAAGSLNLGDIVRSQEGGPLAWHWFWLFPLFVVYFISGVAETNRAPFDVAEGESEIVAGFHVEYSGAAFATLFALPEYANMILIATLAALMFLGGWLSPFEGYLPDAAVAAGPVLVLLAVPQGRPACCSCSCGSAPPSRATATTRSCGSAGRC
jgi:hypothetical protein